MATLIRQVKSEQDSIGGTVACVCRDVPPALGEPVFDRLEAKLAHAMLSLPATKGFEIGSGFAGTLLTGREHNDAFRMMDGKVRDPQQARTLAERLLNHLHTLLYNASRYELDHMEDLKQRFTALVWGLYGHALERVGQGDQTHVPSAMDMSACDRFDLQLL
jgi:hypothetical protein